MASTGERALSVALTLVVVFSAVSAGVAPSPVGTVSAQAGDGSGGPCEASDWFLTFISGTLLTTDCKTAPEVADEWNESAADQARTDIHSSAGQLAAGNEQFLTAMSNSVTDSDTTAFSKGEAAAVETLSNGKNVSQAQAAANESVDSYYVTKQLNLIDRWNVNIATVRTLNRRAQNTTGVDADFVTMGNETSFEPQYNGSGGVVESSIEYPAQANSNQTTYTTLNGTATQQQMLEVYMRKSGGGAISNFGVESEPYRVSRDSVVAIMTHVRVRPTSNLTSRTAMDLSRFNSQMNEIKSQSQTTKEELAVYINDSLAPAVESGDLNASSYVSPATLAQEFAQEYGNDSSYIRATAIAAFSGMDTPDLNNTGSMTISYNGSTYQGLLLSQEAPSGGWESGQSYDPALLSGLQMFAVAGDNGEIIDLDQSFTVEKVTGTDGEEINKATTINVTYETSNASANYTELQQQIRSLNEQIQERQAQATGGGSDTTTNDGLLSKLAALLGVSSGVAVVVVAGVGYVAYRVYVPDP